MSSRSENVDKLEPARWAWLTVHSNEYHSGSKSVVQQSLCLLKKKINIKYLEEVCWRLYQRLVSSSWYRHPIRRNLSNERKTMKIHLLIVAVEAAEIQHKFPRDAYQFRVWRGYGAIVDLVIFTESSDHLVLEGVTARSKRRCHV